MIVDARRSMLPTLQPCELITIPSTLVVAMSVKVSLRPLIFIVDALHAVTVRGTVLR